MSDVVKQHSVTKALSVLVFIFTLGLIYAIIFLPSNKYRHNMETEVKAFSSLVSSDKWKAITSETTKRFSTYYAENGIRHLLYDSLLPDNDYKLKSIIEKPAFHSIIARVLNNVDILVYQICYRFQIFKYWLLLLIPLFVALIYDGKIARDIKLYEPRQVSIKAARLWTRSIAYLLVFSFSYLMVPNFIGQYAAWYPLITLGIAALAIRQTISNFIKVA